MTDRDETEKIIFSPIDISDNTDSGADDNFTRNGNPIITFTGEPGLIISLHGPKRKALSSGSYTVREMPSGLYIVKLLNANPDTGGPQPFGNFFQGIATGNPPNSGDGIYTIFSTDNNSDTNTVGFFEIATKPKYEDNDGADDIFESKVDVQTGQPFDRNGDGIPDYMQRDVATFAGSNEQPITVAILSHTEINNAKRNKSASLEGRTSLLYKGLADIAAIRSEDGQPQPEIIALLEDAIKSNPKNQGISEDLDLVLATTDQPNFSLVPEIIKTGRVTKKKENIFAKKNNHLFKTTTHEIGLFFEERESGDWNALFKPDENGDFFFYGYNPVTGLGGILVDRNDNGRIDGAVVYLKDNELGDLNPKSYIIDDPIGMTELAKTPELVPRSTGDGIYVDGLDGTGLWLNFSVSKSGSSLQNSLLIHSSENNTSRSIGSTTEMHHFGNVELYIKSGEEISFSQFSNNNEINHDPMLNIKQSSSVVTVSLEDNGSDLDFNDLVVDIHSSLLPSSRHNISTARLQQSSHDAILDFSWIPNEGTKVELEVSSNCHFRNTLAFVSLDIDPLTGNNYTDYRVNGVSAFDQNNYRETILDRLIYPNGDPITAKGQQSQTIAWKMTTLDAGIYIPVLFTENGDLITAGLNTAKDGKQHIKILGDNHFAFEDLMADQKPDWDYDDVVMKATVLSA